MIGRYDMNEYLILAMEKNDGELKEISLLPGLPAEMRICLPCLLACRLQAGSYPKNGLKLPPGKIPEDIE